VLLAVGHARTRAALEALFDGEPGFARTASTTDLLSTVRTLREWKPAVVVIDRHLLGHGGLDQLRLLAAVAGSAVVIMVGMEDHPRFAARARAAGAAAYIRLEEAAERLATAARETVSAHSPQR
jgi:DNA-binding NarL/FixJ family response regulator